MVVVTKPLDEESLRDANQSSKNYLLDINRPLCACLAIIIGLILFDTFYTLPEYCETYEWKEHVDNKTVHKVKTSDSSVKVLSIIFLIQAGALLWFGVMHLLLYVYARVKPQEALQRLDYYHHMDEATGAVYGLFYFGGGIGVFACFLFFGPSCENPIWIPMIVASVNSSLFTLFGNLALIVVVCLLALAVLIVISPFYLLYKIVSESSPPPTIAVNDET